MEPAAELLRLLGEIVDALRAINVRLADNPSVWDQLWPILLSALGGGAVTAAVVLFFTGRVEERVGKRLIEHGDEVERQRLRDTEAARIVLRARETVLVPLREAFRSVHTDERDQYGELLRNRASAALTPFEDALAHPDAALIHSALVPVRRWLERERPLVANWDSMEETLYEIRVKRWKGHRYHVEAILLAAMWIEPDPPKTETLTLDSLTTDEWAKAQAYLGWPQSDFESGRETALRLIVQGDVVSVRALVHERRALLVGIEELRDRASRAVDDLLAESSISLDRGSEWGSTVPRISR